MKPAATIARSLRAAAADAARNPAARRPPREPAEARAPRRDHRPPVPAFYIRPKSVEDLVDHDVGRVLDLFDIESDLPHRWREAEN